MRLSFLRNTPHFPFVRLRHIAYVVSGLLLLLSLTAIIFRGGLRYGVDFSGGVAVQIRFAQAVDDEHIKNSLAFLDYPGLAIQQYGEDGHDYLIRFTAPENLGGDELRKTLQQALSNAFPENESSIERLDVVGPKVGADLRGSALEAIYYSVLLITVYISGRFEQRWLLAAGMAAGLGGGLYLLGLLGAGLGLRVLLALGLTLLLCWKWKLNFALGAVVGLLHDVIITVGLLTAMGKEFDLNIVAALLTLIGYSLNDTIICYDRIRENLRLLPNNSEHGLADILDLSLNQTLGRTIMTSGTTLAAVLSLLVLGGGVIHDFALTMFLGVLIGTFSSLFVATPILLELGTIRHYKEKTLIQTYEAPGEHGVV